MKIQFGYKQWDFISNFSQFNISNVRVYMTSQKEVDELMQEQSDLLLNVGSLIPDDVITKEDIEIAILEGRMKENFEGELYVLESRLDELQDEIRKKRLDLLCSLCKGNKKKFVQFCDNTNGVTYGVIREAVKGLLHKLGSFVEFWKSCPLIEDFSIRKPWSFFKTSYKIHELERTTLIRDHLANEQLKMAFRYEDELNADSWENIGLFVATITRPKLQEFEFSFSKNAFIKSKDILGFNHSDRLDYYMEKLEKSWIKRSKIFDKLPLDIAIGIIKNYWKKKRT